jgi:hypothetical protein
MLYPLSYEGGDPGSPGRADGSRLPEISVRVVDDDAGTLRRL